MWADQVYTFCNEHYTKVVDIVKHTGIPIGFITRKLRGDKLNSYLMDTWDECRYGEKWDEYNGT